MASLKSDIVLSLNNLHTRIFRKLDQSMTAHGISFTEFVVLYQLHEAPEGTLRRVDLAEKVGLTASGVTRLLNPMQKIGLVEKAESARDARVSLVKLTNAGKRVFEEASQSFDQCAAYLVEPLSKTQLRSLSTIVETLR